MNNSRIKTIAVSLFIIAIAWISYVNIDKIQSFLEKSFGQNPCQQPIAYSIGTVDSRFGMSRDDFLKAIEEAAQVWEKPFGRTLFYYFDNADLKISLVYDSRQDTTLKLQELGLTINNDQASYNALKAKYDSMISSYNQKKKSLDDQTQDYNSKKASYDSQVSYWNARGGAPKKDYDILEQTRRALNDELNDINQARNEVNDLVESINAAASALNKLAGQLNIKVDTYNGVGAEQSEEFQEGTYKTSAQGREIDIYQFDDHDMLVRVLAHELGHALGIGEHVNDPDAIMYRLNESKNEELTTDDISALKELCHIK